MDIFDIDSLDVHIYKYKSFIIDKLKCEKLNERNLQHSSDLLCQVLDYSPCIKTNALCSSKIFLKNHTNTIPELLQKYPSNLSLSLESTKQIEEDDKESVSEKDSSEYNRSRKVSSTSVNVNNGNDSNNNNNNNNTVHSWIKLLVVNVIDDAFCKAENVVNEGDNEFELLVEHESEVKHHKQSKHMLHRQCSGNTALTKPFISKISNQFNEISKIKIYLLHTTTFIEIEATSSDTFYDLKLKIIETLSKAQTLSLTLPHEQPDAYEIRLVDEDEYEPNMDFAALDDDTNVLQCKTALFAFVENKVYCSSPAQLKPKKHVTSSLTYNKDTRNMSIKIHFKTNKHTHSSSITLSVDNESTLKDILDTLLQKEMLTIKNVDLYYFVEHSDKEEDMDNCINIDTNVKYLNTCEIDLYYKKFPDVPESVSYSQFSQREDTECNLISKQFKEDNENGKEFFFNDISAGMYQEFEVLKVTKFKTKQERVLGVDLYNLYNNLPKDKKHNGKGLLNFFVPKTKKPLRKVKDIVDCGIVDNRLFYITIRDAETNVEKKTIYEVKCNNIRNEITAKINYLIVSTYIHTYVIISYRNLIKNNTHSLHTHT